MTSLPAPKYRKCGKICSLADGYKFANMHRTHMKSADDRVTKMKTALTSLALEDLPPEVKEELNKAVEKLQAHSEEFKFFQKRLADKYKAHLMNADCKRYDTGDERPTSSARKTCTYCGVRGHPQRKCVKNKKAEKAQHEEGTNIRAELTVQDAVQQTGP